MQMKESIRIHIVGALPASTNTSRRELKAAASFFAERSHARAERELGGRWKWHEVTVLLVDNAGSDMAHQSIMGIKGATDVITQAYDAIPPEKPGLLGELIVNVDRAIEAAPARRGWNVASELMLYIAHGMDHLTGADDHDEPGYLRMRRRELGWIREFIKTTKPNR